jgi:hypothetical protein
MNRFSQRRLRESLAEAHLGWREACLQVSDAYRDWAGRTGPGAGLAFGWYTAALDQEESAAAFYAGLLRQAGAPAATALRR